MNPRDQAQRADNARLLAFVFFVPDAKPVVVSECDDQLREGLVRDATTQLAVQRIHRCLTQGITVKNPVLKPRGFKVTS